jgi:hypothetical protein
MLNSDQLLLQAETGKKWNIGEQSNLEKGGPSVESARRTDGGVHLARI